MRRGTVVILAAVLVVAVAIPSQARHLHTRCRTHQGPDGPDGVSFRLCLHTNAHDGLLMLGQRKLQAKLTWRGTYGPGSEWAVRIHVYGLVLFRGGSAVRYRGPLDLRTWEQDHYETGWFFVPRRVQEIAHSSSVGYTLTWVAWPGNPRSDYSTLYTAAWFG